MEVPHIFFHHACQFQRRQVLPLNVQGYIVLRDFLIRQVPDLTGDLRKPGFLSGHPAPVAGRNLKGPIRKGTDDQAFLDPLRLHIGSEFF